ncbi:hypothetical protein GV794_06385 [Nocardia cyriacigeorgica]|uniref:Uncharacterized protein n=1 Tax=Nocardia cyriacigeorgica TaxID=135487 RepID=A0A6P1D9H0_9NOCA|nr:hypothetical protein [Nocardia cyriacigeorgica]NEW40980.1 hypothetical protein [Nocardia cyriacigeorgica]NEW47346.1 hypothetical protein [Nocardia cyriacigeorgica]NEW51214.1 hypothetical protein [Nocardia cyriacigeorgica]NEW55284.1 hypothetical protein [Nocardia cyriacigeorgica]
MAGVMANYPAERTEVAVPAQPRYGMETVGDMLRMSNSSEWRDQFSLELEQPLPNVCSEHGLPAVDRWNRAVTFRRTSRGIEQQSVGVTLRGFGANFFKLGIHIPPVAGNLHGEWPVCARCVRRTTLLRWLARALIIIGLPLLPALLIALQLGVDRIHPGWVVAFFPGWLPVGLFVAMLVYQAAAQFIRFGPIVDPDTVTIRAHPDFAAAVAEQRS